MAQKASRMKFIEVGKDYYFKQFAGRERYWCKVLQKQEGSTTLKVQRYKPEDPWGAPSGDITEVSGSELYYTWTDEKAIL